MSEIVLNTKYKTINKTRDDAAPRDSLIIGFLWFSAHNRVVGPSFGNFAKHHKLRYIVLNEAILVVTAIL